MLTRMARESGVETPTAEDLVRLDRNRKGKKLSNADGQSSTAPDGWIAKLKDGRTHLAYKPEHAMDLDTGAVVTAEVHAADQGDTATMPDTLANAIEHLTAVDAAPSIKSLWLAGVRLAPFNGLLLICNSVPPADSPVREDSSSSELHNLGRESRCVSNRLHPLNQRSFGVCSEKLGGRFRGHWATNQRKRAGLTVDIQRKWAAAIQRSWADL